MSKVFCVADLHFGHKLLAELRGFASTQEHDDALVRNWNSVVTKRDVVYVLGDVFQLDRMADLCGIKKLAMGNHDQKPIEAYAKHFSQVRACYAWDNCLLTHIPVHPCQLGRWRKNIHGHMHEKPLQDSRYVCVSAEQINLTPVLLRDLTSSP